MAFVEIDVPPGIVKSESDYAARGRWIDCDHVRFSGKYPEKIGGVIRLDYEIDEFDGIARGAQAWATYQGVQCLAFGTACQFYVYREADLRRLTPYRPDAIAEALANDPFAVVDTQTLVTVTHTAHGIESAGTVVTFSGASAGGGITIDGDYEVVAVLNANSFTINHSTPATSTDATTGGAAVLASYELNCGNVDPTYLLGWGVGGWGVGGWGVDASIASAIISEPLTWSLSVYGEDLVVNPAEGAIYIYDAGGGSSRPALLTGAPTRVRYTFVTPERYIFALGCLTIAGPYDPMTVRWPDIEDPTDWTPSDINTANQRKLQGGTRLMAGVPLADGISLVWSDAGLFVFQFTGSKFVYDSRMVADKCGLVGPHAQTIAGSTAFWMTEHSFWMYDGYARPIANVENILDHVFKGGISKTHRFKSFAFHNARFNEIWFVYPSAGSTEPDRYVAVSLLTFEWIVGTWSRSAAATYTTSEDRPVMFGTNGVIYLHENEDVPDDDGAALPSHLELAPTAIDGGNRIVDIWGVVPDTQRQSGDVVVYIYGKDHPRDSEFMSDQITITPTDRIGDMRGVAGRQFGMRISTVDTGCDWRWGIWGIEITAAGKQRASSASAA